MGINKVSNDVKGDLAPHEDIYEVFEIAFESDTYENAYALAKSKLEEDMDIIKNTWIIYEESLDEDRVLVTYKVMGRVEDSTAHGLGRGRSRSRGR